MVYRRRTTILEHAQIWTRCDRDAVITVLGEEQARGVSQTNR